MVFDRGIWFNRIFTDLTKVFYLLNKIFKILKSGCQKNI
jgi:hypothetical protein